jgi:hypothetical protein
MKEELPVTLIAYKRVNENNEVMPTEYVVKTAEFVIARTTDFVFAMQCFVNRCR